MASSPYLDPEYFNRLTKMVWDYVGEVAKLYLGEETAAPLLANRVTKRQAQQQWFATPEEQPAILEQVGKEGLLGPGGLFGGNGEHA